MSILTLLTVVRWYQRMMGLPSGPTRNFSKFQRMSWTFMGSQKRRLGEPTSSEVGGQEFWAEGEWCRLNLAPPKSRVTAAQNPTKDQGAPARDLEDRQPDQPTVPA